MIANYLAIQKGDTFESILVRHKGVGPSFDLLRFLLALLLLIGHTKWIAGAQSLGAMVTAATTALPEGPPQPTQFTGVTKPVVRSLVPAFFALSGFLVVASAFRLRSTPHFLAHRALRIFPALIVEVTLSALILGTWLTTLPWPDYFSDPVFLRYFGNVIGWVAFDLPGVFRSNPVTSVVNINLWTLPAEFYCYLITAALLVTAVLYNRFACSVAFVLVTIGLAAAHFLFGVSTTRGPFPTHVITYYFFVGAMFYHYRAFIPMRVEIFVIALAVSYGALMFDSLTYLAPVPLTYCTLFFGLAKLPTIKLLSRGDYSYGIYLYGFPIGQTLLAVFPRMQDHVVVLTLMTALTTFAFAAFSWHLIEKRALTLKRFLSRRPLPVPTAAGMT